MKSYDKILGLIPKANDMDKLRRIREKIQIVYDRAKSISKEEYDSIISVVDKRINDLSGSNATKED